MSERVRCPVCGKIIGGYVPRGGDGSALRPRSHRNKGTGRPCEGRFHLLERSDAKPPLDERRAERLGSAL